MSPMKTEAPPVPNPKQRPFRPAGMDRPLDSAELLGAKDEVAITHEGETYRLRRTRQGKLILTK